MMEEQLLQVNKKIKQIEGLINRRKQKASQWNVHYTKILQDKQNKQYLQKACNTRINFKSLNNEEYGKIGRQLQKKVSCSRIKIKKYYNQLKDLHELQKEKNKIRVIVLERKRQCQGKNGKNQEKESVNTKFRALSEIEKIQTNNEKHQILCRTTKERANPFSEVKADKFIEISQQKKENLGPQLMKYFGVGIESTPIGFKLKKEEKKEEMYSKNESKKYRDNKMSKTSFGKDFKKTFEEKQEIFGMGYQPRNIFEDRMRKIIKYHGDFWGREFGIQ